MKIRSIIFNIAFYGWTFLIGFFGLPLSFTHPSLAVRVARSWTRVNIWLLRVICGITFELRGREHIPHGAALVASKHQSAWDTTIFWLLLKRPTYVLKRELIYIPVFGWQLLLLKSIYIDRKSGASAMKRMLRESQKRIQERRSIVIFPEGTRIAPGSTGTYHPGIAALYQNLKLPVTPVALNSGLYWGRKAFLKKSGTIIIEFLPAIPPGLKSREFLVQLQERIETASAVLVEEGRRALGESAE